VAGLGKTSTVTVQNGRSEVFKVIRRPNISTSAGYKPFLAETSSMTPILNSGNCVHAPKNSVAIFGVAGLEVFGLLNVPKNLKIRFL
jgi:signal peptidase I